MEQKLDKAVEAFNHNFVKMRSEIAKVVVGHDEVVEFILIALISNGNVLLEGVPGIGKTLLVKTLSEISDLRYSRIQFTPDLMPADITGTKVIFEGETGLRHFEFQQGPVFANIVLADELNRASPKTQSALLEVMQERCVTVGGHTYKVGLPYMILATQNPDEMEGTYPLPEAQKDRFMFHINVKYPDKNGLLEIARRMSGNTREPVAKVVDADMLDKMSRIASDVPVPSIVEDYAVKLIMATHPEYSGRSRMVCSYVKYGSSPRGLICLLQAAKIKALLSGRYNASSDDIRYAAHACLRHRLILTFEAEAEGVNVDEIIDNVIEVFS